MFDSSLTADLCRFPVVLRSESVAVAVFGALCWVKLTILGKEQAGQGKRRRDVLGISKFLPGPLFSLFPLLLGRIRIQILDWSLKTFHWREELGYRLVKTDLQ